MRSAGLAADFWALTTLRRRTGLGDPAGPGPLGPLFFPSAADTILLRWVTSLAASRRDAWAFCTAALTPWMSASRMIEPIRPQCRSIPQRAHLQTCRQSFSQVRQVVRKHGPPYSTSPDAGSRSPSFRFHCPDCMIRAGPPKRLLTGTNLAAFTEIPEEPIDFLVNFGAVWRA